MVFPVMILDSSFLVSLCLPWDEKHAEALSTLEKYRDSEMLLTDMVLFETLTVVAYKAGTAFARDAYSRLMTNKKLVLVFLSEQERREILDEFLHQEGKMSVEDISVVHSSKKALSPALTFDRQILKKIGKMSQSGRQ